MVTAQGEKHRDERTQRGLWEPEDWLQETRTRFTKDLTTEMTLGAAWAFCQAGERGKESVWPAGKQPG